ncbi:MAG: hypothetical protein LC105_03860 [Chitinophagales bacterium]|nr:hypothetical protein [Chitinophagales bacterium]
MNQPTLHTGLAHLLEASGVKSQYPEVVRFSAYNPGEQDVLGSGIIQLVKFRLLHPEIPVLFFSFLPKETLLPKDEFGVLQIARTEFIQLPCSKENILQAAANQCAKPLGVTEAAWKTFAEKACKALLLQRIKELNHGNKFAIGNMVLNPLRLNCSGLLCMPHLKEDYLPLLQKNFDALHNYAAVSDIAELLHWCMISTNSSDVYLQNAFAFASQLHQLSQYSAQTDAAEIISLIDRVNDSFKQLQPE